jgi:hypothetical protein
MKRPVRCTGLAEWRQPIYFRWLLISLVISNIET